ncbi:Sporulation protein YjcA [Bacillus rhizoplanae]|uniref:Sporulation protein YjcA n=1 Tax=Bacillus rhizoplanae TaxID=2880966 RepID=A0ABM8YG04_9BACI|nr:Sporulation protein YjcA [Bacillus rhizoplanae]
MRSLLFESWLMFIIFSFAVFRLTHLLVYDKIASFIRAPFVDEIQITEEDGTVSTYMKIRETGIRKFFGELLSCYWCTGIWASALLLLCYEWIPKVAEPIILLLAVAGVAAIIETIVSRWMGN